MSGPFKAVRSYLKAIQLIRIHGWWGYVFAPGLISLFLVLTAVYFGFDFVNALFSGINYESWPEWTHAIWLPWLLRTLAKLVMLVIVFTTYKSLVLVISAPMLSVLAEKTAKVIGLTPSSPMEWPDSVSRSMWINIIYFTRSMFWFLLSLLAALIPFVGPILFTGINFSAQSFYAGAGLLDFGFEMKGYSSQKSQNMVNKHYGAVSGLGICFSLLLAIPFVGWFFAPPLGAIAGTILSAELE